MDKALRIVERLEHRAGKDAAVLGADPSRFGVRLKELTAEGLMELYAEQ